MIELEAVWLGGFKVNGSPRVPVGAHIAIENGKMVDADYATHKIIGLFGTVPDTEHVAIVTDAITNDPQVFIINY